MDVWRQRCAGYGYREGTDTFAACVQNEARAYQARIDKAQRNIGCLAGDKTQCDNQPVTTTTNCTKDFLGNMRCTTQ